MLPASDRTAVHRVSYLVITGRVYDPAAFVEFQAALVPVYATEFEQFAGNAGLVGNEVFIVHFNERQRDD